MDQRLNYSGRTISKFEISHIDSKYGSNSQQVFDFYQSELTKESDKKPLIVLLHSGAFILGDKRDDEIVELAENIARRGISVASIN